jgi:2-polyprenyl-3-methyl-5-hydroxy-6-metoxy-1,4-benzoquinol methylase
MFMSNTDANSLLKMYRMHVVDTEQARELLCRRDRVSLQSNSSRPFKRLLDVGAGDGTCTTQLAPLFESVTCTEVRSRSSDTPWPD